MFYICVRVRTTEANPDFPGVDEAYAGCWINTDDQETAVDTATARILEDAWTIEEVESAEPVTLNDYEDDAEYLKYYEQALTDHAVLVFHMCPRYTTYFVQFDVQRDEKSDDDETITLSADATVWVSVSELLNHESPSEDVDFLAPDFWSDKRANMAVEIAQAVIVNEGWTVSETIKHFPYENRQLDKQPEMKEFVDSAEETGVSLVIWDRSD